jgi:hypothetical protein
MLGIFGTALIIAAMSVYIFHDVDQDKIGHWNEAFVGLCVESVLFTIIVGGGVALLTLLGRHFFPSQGIPPRAMLGLLLGVGVTVLQYPWEFAVRRRLPTLAGISLYVYLVTAIVLCTAVIIRENFKQMKLCQAPAAPLDH